MTKEAFKHEAEEKTYYLSNSGCYYCHKPLGIGNYFTFYISVPISEQKGFAPMGYVVADSSVCRAEKVACCKECFYKINNVKKNDMMKKAEKKTCYNCGNKNCNVYYSTVKKDYKRHFETYEYKDFDCVNHDKWEEIHTDNTKTLQNALERIKELEKENAELKDYRLNTMVKEQTELSKYALNLEHKLGGYDTQLTKAKEIIETLSKSLFLAKGIIRDLIDDTVDFKESKERAKYCYEQESFDVYKEAEQFLKEVDE